MGHEHVVGRLIELDHIDPIGLQRQRLLVEQLGKSHRELFAAAVVGVGDGIDDGHRAGQRELQLLCGVRPGDLRFEGMHATLQTDRAHDLRHHRVIAIVADAHLDLVLEVDALDRFEKAMHEVLAALLAVGDDVQAGVLLLLDPEQGGVALGLAQRIALLAPLRPQLLGLGEPAGFGQAAGKGGLEHGGPQWSQEGVRKAAGKNAGKGAMLAADHPADP